MFWCVVADKAHTHGFKTSEMRMTVHDGRGIPVAPGRGNRLETEMCMI